MKIPEYAENLLIKLENAGFETFVVGGCVRDLLKEKHPKDWDLTTAAKPEQIMEIFPDGKYENQFGTVLIPIKNEDGETEHVMEITTYRSEQGYSDRRRPDQVFFENELEKDLARRDFTINALAMKPKDSPIPIPESLSSHASEIEGYCLVDLFGGRNDLKKKIIRAVGEPEERFKEDALRMLRAVRFSAQIGFEIEDKTLRAVKKLSSSIRFVSNERIRDELIKILESDRPYEGFMLLYKNNLLNYIIPELLQGDGVAQNHHHIYSVLKHNMLSLKFCPSKDWRVRFAALMHDVGKPKSKRMEAGIATFHNHEMISERIIRKIMARLKFSKEDTEKVATLVRYHMFYYNVGEVTAASVRRLIGKVGQQNLQDLIDVRKADRLGSGVPKAEPYKLRHLQYMIKKVQNDPVSVKMLKIGGHDLMDELEMEPGPKIGAILDVLLSEVIEDPKLNSREYLLSRSEDLKKLDLEELRSKAREVIEEERKKEDKKIKRKFKVK